MSGGGSRPKPTKLKVLEGTWRPDRVPANEPIPVDVPPEPPEDMTDEARRYWDRVMEDMPSAWIVRVDGAVLRRWCDACVQADEMQVLLQTRGALIRGARTRGDRAEIVVNPAWRIYRQAVDVQLRTGDMLGLSPTARARVPMPGRDVSSTQHLERLLS